MINSRALLMMIAVFTLFIILIIELINIQIVKSEELKYLAERQQTSVEKIEAERGLIFDRNKTLLVYNRNDISFYLDLRMAAKEIKNKIAKKFSSVFGKSIKHYIQLMNQQPKTICIEEKAPSEKALLLKDFKAAGLFFREDPTRVYHYKNFSSHIIGFVDNEYNGVTGIEKSFEKILQGEDGTRLIERNAIGDMITIEEEETIPAQPGVNLVLTINKLYQIILEEELKKGLDQYGGVSAVGIMMDPNNGEILAFSNMNDYDPNNYSKYGNDTRRNKALTDTYEPGSTFKSITMAALLDQKLCNENDLIYVENGRYKFRNVHISDTHKHDYLTAQGVIEQSSNIGMAKLVQRIDDDLFYKYLRGFGFGNYTSIPLPGEAKGTLRKPNEWSALSKSFLSFGYEISVTPLQLITAYSAIINGGILYKPQIVKEEISNDGNIISQIEPKEIRRVISEKTSERMRKILTAVVEKGTGKNAKPDFISAGGKTGTSQKLIDGKYSSSHYNTSFVGFFPANNPKVVCLILINSPSNGYYGGLVAAPIFKKITERAAGSNPNQFKIEKPEVENNELEIIYAEDLSGLSLSFNQVKDISQFNFKRSRGIMPDLKNYNLRDAISILSKLGIKYKIKGSGKVIAQSIDPGEKISKTKVCTLTCKEIKVNGTAVY